MVPTIVTNDSLHSIDVKDLVLHKGCGVKGLSEMGLDTLPEQYIQPPKERIDVTDVIVDGSIPVIDLSNWDTNPDVAKQVCDAAEKWGFFQIVKHGVPDEVLKNVIASAHRFFESPAEEKIKFSNKHSPTNNVRYGTSFSPDEESVLEWKDSLNLLYVSEDEATTMWPPNCRSEVLEYVKKTDSVIKRLIQALVENLKIEHIDKTKELLLMGSKRARLNYYPICPNPELVLGAGCHSDISTLTILLQDDTGGLQVRGAQAHTWIQVPPIPGSIVINIGDALQIMSNDKYKSVEHRVMVSGVKNRVSVPIFVSPGASEIIGPFSELLKNGEKPVYKEIGYSDYAKHFFSKPHDGKGTIEFVRI